MATTVTVASSRDTYVASDSPTLSFATTQQMIVGGTSQALLYFPITLPTGAVVSSASLRVVTPPDSGAGSLSVTLARVTSAWSESVTYNSRPTYVDVSAGSLAGASGVADGIQILDVTALVQAWTSSTNNGILLRSTAGSKPVYAREAVSLSRVPTLTVTYNAPPTAPPLLTPANNEALNKDADNRFSWLQGDPEGDGQSGYGLRYRIVGAPAWTTLTGSTPNQYRDLPAGTFAAGPYEWQAQTTDTGGLAGPWSSSGFFSAASLPPGPAITAPVNGATVGEASVVVTWTASAQTSYQVRSVADNAGSPDTATVYYDSGEVTPSSVRQVTVPLPVNSRYEHLQVRVKDAGLFSPWSSVRVLVSYTLPATALLSVQPVQTIASAYAFTDANAVTIVNPAPTGGQPSVAYRNVWCQATTDGDPYRPLGVPVRIATAVPQGVFTDRAAASGVDYKYAVEQVAVNGTTSMSTYVGDVRDLGITPGSNAYDAATFGTATLG